MNDWPIVDVKDDGIRPAGPQDTCTYCRQKIGTPHLRDCVIVTKRVLLRVTARLPDGTLLVGDWEKCVPYSDNAQQIEHHLNDGFLCANTFMQEQDTAAVTWLLVPRTKDPWQRLREIFDANACLCAVLHFNFLRVLDETPRCLIRER
ncbi:MAG: hypothetical protein OK454_08630 [Thaumarchaeota archaeon]|nr:hypothetical protein [Nitrososphaerota archaeon]